MNGPEAVEALTVMQGWILDGLVDRNADDAAFVQGRSPISWVGHGLYPAYRETFPRTTSPSCRCRTSAAAR